MLTAKSLGAAGCHGVPRRAGKAVAPRIVADASALALAAILATAPITHAGERPGSCAPEGPRVEAGRVAESRVGTNPLAELSAFGVGGDASAPEERDPLTPFTLFGTTVKKLLIEELQGEKIVARKKGFTVDACVGAVQVTQETPAFQSLPAGDKARFAKDRVCRKAEGPDLKETCRSACEVACNDVLSLYSQQVKDESGFELLAKDSARMGKSCVRTCSYECQKSGRAFDFVVPYRR